MSPNKVSEDLLSTLDLYTTYLYRMSPNKVSEDLRGKGSTWARLSVVCVAGGRLCSAVSCRVPLAVSRAGFAWQGQHLGTSVCCLCRRRPFVFRRVVPCSACCLQSWICVAGAALGHVCLLSVSPAAVCVPPCRGVFRLRSPGLVSIHTISHLAQQSIPQKSLSSFIVLEASTVLPLHFAPF